MTATTMSVYLIHRRHPLGIRNVSGVPSDYILGFYKAQE